jgi:hypothetical protein
LPTGWALIQVPITAITTSLFIWIFL